MRIDRFKFAKEMMKKGITQTQLANESGVSRVTINYIKSGKSCSDVVGEKIAKALKVDIKELIEVED